MKSTESDRALSIAFAQRRGDKTGQRPEPVRKPRVTGVVQPLESLREFRFNNRRRQADQVDVPPGTSGPRRKLSLTNDRFFRKQNLFQRFDVRDQLLLSYWCPIRIKDEGEDVRVSLQIQASRLVARHRL